ncbi:MAG: type I-U CRISPR-associated protein Csb2 [Blastocatellia bacterium]
MPSQKYLQIRLTFAERRYHGRRAEDELEYPPAPARLFQALIAGSHQGAYGVIHTAARDRALQWLESLDPPHIDPAAVCQTGSGVTNYVPNNDDGKKENPLEHVRTAKSFLAHVFPGEATLTYRWRYDATPEAGENAAVICAMARLITHLGQHQDTVYVSGEIIDVGAEADSSGMRHPVERDDGAWTAPREGALAAYQQRYQAWLRGESRDDIPVPLRQVDYITMDTIHLDAPLALFELWRNEDERHRFDPCDLRQPAAMVRHAMIAWRDQNPAYQQYYGAELSTRLITGHVENRQNDGQHIACVPIPSLNENDTADGLIRRVLLIGLGCGDQNSRELFDAVAAGISGATLRDQGADIGFLKRAELNDSVLRLFTGRACRVWRTVTPIIFTGMMRRGRGPEQLIARALGQAGFAEADVDSIAAFSGPIVPKTAHALDYRMDKNDHHAQMPRYHAEVIFRRPVKGGLVVGRGKHYGFGLMIPCAEYPNTEHWVNAETDLSVVPES